MRTCFAISLISPTVYPNVSHSLPLEISLKTKMFSRTKKPAAVDTNPKLKDYKQMDAAFMSDRTLQAPPDTPVSENQDKISLPTRHGHGLKSFKELLGLKKYEKVAQHEEFTTTKLDFPDTEITKLQFNDEIDDEFVTSGRRKGIYIHREIPQGDEQEKQPTDSFLARMNEAFGDD